MLIAILVVTSFLATLAVCYFAYFVMVVLGFDRLVQTITPLPSLKKALIVSAICAAADAGMFIALSHFMNGPLGPLMYGGTVYIWLILALSYPGEWDSRLMLGVVLLQRVLVFVAFAGMFSMFA